MTQYNDKQYNDKRGRHAPPLVIMIKKGEIRI